MANANTAKLISSDEVHVRCLFLNEVNTYIEPFQKILSVDEIERATKFHFEKDRRKFIVARGTLRKILGYYLAIKPEEIIFEYTSFDKPIIAHKQNNDNINFNLSHSDELVLYAVTLNRKIGIDVERIRNNIDVLQIANKFFSSNEIAALQNTNKENQHKAFFQLWTRKEALIKGLGEGISFPLEQIDVSLTNEKPSLPVILPSKYKECLEWYVYDLLPENGYVSAIAMTGNNCKIICLHGTEKIASLQELDVL
jgi:4'-phosphopantetheinyl transferase